MPKKKRSDGAYQSKKVTLNELIRNLQQFSDVYGDCPIIGITETLGEVDGMTNPFLVRVTVSADEGRSLYARSGHGSIRTFSSIQNRTQNKKVKDAPAQLQLF